MLPTDLPARLARNAPTGVDFWTARAVAEDSQQLMVRQGVVEPPQQSLDRGVMVSVAAAGPLGTGLGHAATADLSDTGLRAAFARARSMAQATGGHMAFDPAWAAPQAVQGQHHSQVSEPLSA